MVLCRAEATPWQRVWQVRAAQRDAMVESPPGAVSESGPQNLTYSMCITIDVG